MENIGKTKKRLNNQAKKYLNISMIIQRIENQGYLDKIHNLLHEIKEQENDFTLKELTKMQEINNNQNEEFNLQEVFLNNSSIFESNISLILQLMVKEIWDKDESIKFLNSQNQKKPKTIPTKQQFSQSLQHSSSNNLPSKINNNTLRQSQQQFPTQQQLQQQNFMNSFNPSEKILKENLNSTNKMPPKSISSQPIKNIDEAQIDNRPTPSFRKQVSDTIENQENIVPNIQEKQLNASKQNQKKKLIGFGNVPLPKSFFTHTHQNPSNLNNTNNHNLLQHSQEFASQSQNSLQNTNYLKTEAMQDSPKQIRNSSNRNFNNQQSRPRIQSAHGAFSKSYSDAQQGKLLDLSPIKSNQNDYNELSFQQTTKIN